MCKKYIDNGSLSKIKKLSNSSRYRILLLTSAPILTTLIVLICITLYWSFSYTWKNTLHDVSTRLQIAKSSFQLIKVTQESNLRAISQACSFKQLLKNNVEEYTINDNLKKLEKTYGFDYIKFHYYINSNITKPLNFGSSFEILSSQQLEYINPELPAKAKIKLVDSESQETNALVLRTIFEVTDNNSQKIGYIEAGLLVNNSMKLVDKLRDLIYPATSISNSTVGTVTIFLNDIRVSTNLQATKNQSNDERAIGTRVSPKVADKVLNKGDEWIGIARVLGERYITAYQPIKDSNDNIIGMLYTGYSVCSFLEDYIISISIIFVTASILLLTSTYFIIKESHILFSPLEKIGDVVLRIRNGERARIGALGLHNEHELSLLATQFDQMLDDLEERNNEISSLVSFLEVKVEERTEKLKVKTRQLEHHIDLLNQTKDKLVAQEKFAALGVLTAGIAHEINNPVAVILGNVELINRAIHKNDMDVLSEIETIFNQIDRIKSIIYSLLQYSKSSSNPNCKPFIQNVNPIVVESITLTNTGTNKRNVDFNLDLNATNKVLIDKNQLLQVLINLELNAIDAIHHQGEIRITTHDAFDYKDDLSGIIIEVIDSGCGIDHSNINKIFDPFFTTKREGTGLGLAVTSNLVNQMGGEISVSTNDDKETIFTVFLPLPEM